LYGRYDLTRPNKVSIGDSHVEVKVRTRLDPKVVSVKHDSITTLRYIPHEKIHLRLSETG
jgi:hypothetical protein